MWESDYLRGNSDLRNECWCMLAVHPAQFASGECCLIVGKSVKFELMISLCPARFHRLLGLIEFDSEEMEVISVATSSISNLKLRGSEFVVELSFTVSLNRIYEFVERLENEEILQWLKANVPEEFLSPPPPKPGKGRRTNTFRW